MADGLRGAPEKSSQSRTSPPDRIKAARDAISTFIARLTSKARTPREAPDLEDVRIQWLLYLAQLFTRVTGNSGAFQQIFWPRGSGPTLQTNRGFFGAFPVQSTADIRQYIKLANMLGPPSKKILDERSKRLRDDMINGNVPIDAIPICDTHGHWIVVVNPEKLFALPKSEQLRLLIAMTLDANALSKIPIFSAIPEWTGVESIVHCTFVEPITRALALLKSAWFSPHEDASTADYPVAAAARDAIAELCKIKQITSMIPWSQEKTASIVSCINSPISLADQQLREAVGALDPGIIYLAIIRRWQAIHEKCITHCLQGLSYSIEDIDPDTPLKKIVYENFVLLITYVCALLDIDDGGFTNVDHLLFWQTIAAIRPDMIIADLAYPDTLTLPEENSIPLILH